MVTCPATEGVINAQRSWTMHPMWATEPPHNRIVGRDYMLWSRPERVNLPLWSPGCSEHQSHGFKWDSVPWPRVCNGIFTPREVLPGTSGALQREPWRGNWCGFLWRLRESPKRTWLSLSASLQPQPTPQSHFNSCLNIIIQWFLLNKIFYNNGQSLIVHQRYSI